MKSNGLGYAFVEQATSFLLDDYQPKIERCLEQLTDEQVWWRPNENSNSIGNLVLHLCGNARQWIVCGVGGSRDLRRRDEEFAQREVIGREELVQLLDQTLKDVAKTLSALEPDLLLQSRTIQEKEVNLLEAIFHVTEHFSMHTGQIIQLTKLLTGRDLCFYDFEADAPVERWQSGSHGSS